MKKFSAAHLFSHATSGAGTQPRIGAEIELLPFDAGTTARAQFSGSLGQWLDRAAHAGKWKTLHSEKGAPKYEIADAGTLTLEPGGQVEFSTQPTTTVDALNAVVQNTVSALVASASAYGIELMTIGMDPENSTDAVALQLDVPRYRAMDRYFREVSPAGIRMMRQTAALQVNIDATQDTREDPYRTWRALNRAAPVLTAMFANSRRYAGTDSGYASYRARTWMELDPSRTGLFGGRDAVAEYSAFAAGARVIADEPAYRPFREIGEPTEAMWTEHLGTLFPEIRPKKYYEIRCIDSIPLKYVGAAFAVIAALAWDDATLSAALEKMHAPDRARWEAAARNGLRDGLLAEDARVLAKHAVNVFPQYSALIGEWMSVASGSAALENDFVRDDHVADRTLACLGE